MRKRLQDLIDRLGILIVLMYAAYYYFGSPNKESR